MQNLDLNQFIKDAHENAVAHGWWDKHYSLGTIRSLMHCELSEAMKEYREKRPMVWHKCPHHTGTCETMQVQDDDLHCEACKTESRKPEGIAVELMDFVIWVFDYLGSAYFVMPQSMNTARKLADWAVDDFQSDEVEDVIALDLPELVDVLHTHIALSQVMHNVTYLTSSVGIALAWVEARGVDAVKLLLEKHEYNKTRSYKHGGKVC